jgi:hypothetical protein
MVALAHQCARALERATLLAAEREARRRAEYLVRTGELLAASLSPAATLDEVARLAVPELADWAFVELSLAATPAAGSGAHRRGRTTVGWRRVHQASFGFVAPPSALRRSPVFAGLFWAVLVLRRSTASASDLLVGADLRRVPEFGHHLRVGRQRHRRVVA